MRAVNDIKSIFYRPLHRWITDCSGVAFAEFALIFPILFVLLFGVYDVGNAILANQKAISASQIVADLVTRQIVVSPSELEEALRAGQLAMQPFDLENYGIEVASLGFLEDDEVDFIWRENRNTDLMEEDDIAARVEPLHTEGEGVIMVAARYRFEPVFWGFVVRDIQMEEVAFARGRRNPTIEMGAEGE